jgi:hypothetical protein
MPPFYHILFAFAFVSRASDLLTTWLVSPTLKLEANPVARRFRWPFGFLTLFAALLAYWFPEMCVALTTTSFLVAGSNAMKIPMARSMGEEAYYKMTLESVAKGSFWPGLLSRLAPAPFYVFLAGLIFFTNASNTWAYWIGFGVVCYALVLVLWGTTSYVRLRKIGRATLKVTQ